MSAVVVELNQDSRITDEIRLAVLLGLRRVDGTLHPADIVESASAADSPLHNEFEWDDTKAGQQYRLTQAQRMIRLVPLQIKGSDEPVRAFVSLREDRADRAGYRLITDVMTDERKAANLLNEMRRDAAALLKKVAVYQKLAGSEVGVKKLKQLIAALQNWTATEKAA